MKKRILILLGVILILGVLGFSSSTLEQPTLIYRIPDTEDAKEIIKTVERAYKIEAQAALTFDFSDFPTVFINDPRFPMGPYTLETIRDLTHNPSLETAGYLDYKLAYYTWSRDEILHLEALQEKAKKENRNLTEEELQSLRDSKGRTPPARAEGPLKLIPLNFMSLEINGDIATAILDDGPTVTKITLVLVDGQWYIADASVLIVNM
jgi:hypothetical protein